VNSEATIDFAGAMLFKTDAAPLRFNIVHIA